MLRQLRGKVSVIFISFFCRQEAMYIEPFFLCRRQTRDQRRSLQGNGVLDKPRNGFDL